MTDISNETYFMPAHGWTCFHCGETFMTPKRAREHFGADPLATPGCRIRDGEERGLLQALRQCEADLRRYQEQGSEAERTITRLEAEHARALREAEEAGYAKGVEDGLSLLDQIEADGLAAARSGLEADACPYEFESRRGIAWLAGWGRS